MRGYGNEGEGSRSIVFSEGQRCLVYAYRGGGRGDGPLATSICEGTKPLAAAGEDLLALGSAEVALPDTAPPAPVVSGTAATPAGARIGVAMLVAAPVTVLLVVGLAFVIRRRWYMDSG